MMFGGKCSTAVLLLFGLSIAYAPAPEPTPQPPPSENDCPIDDQELIDFNNMDPIDDIRFEGKSNPADVTFTQDPKNILLGANGPTIIMSKNADGEDTLVVELDPKVQMTQVMVMFKLVETIKLTLFDKDGIAVFDETKSNSNANYWGTAVWIMNLADITKAVIAPVWGPGSSDEAKVKDLNFGVCDTPQEDDCHCQILADPVVNTCSGETLFMEQTGASYRAVESNDPGCTFTLDAEPVDNSLKLTLEMGANMWTISPDGTVDPALPAIPGVTAVNFVDGSYTGTNYQFDCGIEIRFGTEGDNFVKADIKVPGGKRDNIVDGFCVTDSLGKKTTTTTTTPPPI